MPIAMLQSNSRPSMRYGRVSWICCLILWSCSQTLEPGRDLGPIDARTPRDRTILQWIDSGPPGEAGPATDVDDVLPPTIVVSDMDPDWRTHEATITIGVSDPSGVNFAQFRWNGGEWTGFQNGETVDLPGDGVSILEIEAEDLLGNVTRPIWTIAYRLCAAAGYYVSADACVQADPGYFSPANDLSRYPCPTGLYSSPGASRKSDCSDDCPAGQKVFSYTGGEVAWKVPPGCTEITAKIWGAGGGGDDGAAGGFSTGALVAIAGETLILRVGGNMGVFGGGAGSVNTVCEGERGGDYSGVFHKTTMIIAGGGGGGGCAVGSYIAGAGGGAEGQEGGCCTAGTQLAAGCSTSATYSVCASEYLGGAAEPGTALISHGGGGGGGGYFGGGGACAGDIHGNGGCGGSGFAPSGGTTEAGDGVLPPRTTDSDYGDSAGAPQTPGRIVLIWGNS